MIQLMNKKKSLTQILGPDPSEVQAEPESALHACVSELIGAIQAGDVDSACEALRACYAEMSSSKEG